MVTNINLVSKMWGLLCFEYIISFILHNTTMGMFFSHFIDKNTED